MICIHMDVLAIPHESFIMRQPSVEGRRLWEVMFSRYKGRMVVVADHGTKLEVVQEWLKRENLKPSFIHIGSDFVRDNSTSRADAVWWVNTNMGRPIWYIDSDPDTCAAAVKMGIPTLLVAIPSFQRPEWYDSPGVRPWDSVVKEVEEQALRRNEMSWKEE
jgi:hypothetical protein